MQDNLYNIAFERSILSSIVFDPILFEEISVVLKSDDFYLPSHGAIFLSMEVLTKSNKPIDEEFIKKELIKIKAFDEQVMLEILSANPISNTKAYVDEILDKSKSRKILALASGIRKLIVEDNATSDTAIAEIETQLIKLDSSSDIDMPIDMNVAINQFNTMTPPPLIKTGLRAIDTMLCGGIESAQLIHIGGESNVGKTLLTKQILKNIADHHKTLFFSFEMPKWKIAKQLANSNFNRQNYFITDSQMMGNDISDVSRMIKRMKRKKDIRFVVIDSKMKLSNNHYKGNSSVEKISEIDAILARLCQELDIVIFMITQLSKEDQRNGTMSGYNSGLSDYEADMKILLSFVDGSKDTRRKIQVMKNRQDVSFEPVTLVLDTKTLEFMSVHVTETIYDSNLPFSGNKVNETYKPKDMPPKPKPIDEDMSICIEGGQFL
ncbi:MAG: DnaB-like helicase N-terminal domain-containing protein [Sulfurimonas sp.]